MKQRIISAAVAIIILIFVLFLHHTVVFNITLAIVSLIACYELLNATNLIKHKVLAVVPFAFSVILPFALHEDIKPLMPLIIFIIAIYFFLTVISNHSKIAFSDMAMSLMFSVFVPLFFSAAIYLRDDYGAKVGLYYLALALGSAWFCDTCAYFAGYFFGKHKMAPVISPKKTVEGAIGGIIGTVILNIGVSYLITYIYLKQGKIIEINYFLLGLISPILALLGMLGDLTASVIKRQYNVKDYGHIMPGHGGIMDRFDSALFTLPSVYILTKLVTMAV